MVEEPVEPRFSGERTPNDPRSQAARGAALLSVRQILVGAITVVGIVALPLLLGPADFSLYGYVNMIVLLGAAIGDLGLGAYLIKHRVSDRQLRGMLGVQLLFWILTASILMAIAIVVDPFGFTTVTYALLCIGLMFFSLQALPAAVMEKRLAFERISLLEVTQRVILVAVAICLAVFEPTEWAIPLAALVAAGSLYPAFLRLARWPGLPLLIRGEPVFKGFASEWWQTRISNQLAYAAFPLLGGVLFTAEEVGLLIWALSISLIPGYLAPMAARAIYPVMTRASKPERNEIHELLLRGLLFLGAPLVIFTFLVAPSATEAIFGSPWTEAVTSLRILLVANLVGVCLSMSLPHVFLGDRPATVKWLSLLSTLLVFALGIALSSSLNFEAIPVASLVSGVLLLIGFELLLRRSDGFSAIRVAAPAFISLALALLLTLPVIGQLGDSLGVVIPVAFGGILIQLGLTRLMGGGVSLRSLRTELASLRSGSP